MGRAIRVLIYLLLTAIGLDGGNAFAQNQAHEQPIRVGIVGLEHGHIAGFLKQFPNQHDVQLVGITTGGQWVEATDAVDQLPPGQASLPSHCRRAMASRMRSVLGRWKRSRCGGGYGMSKPVTRRIGASR